MSFSAFVVLVMASLQEAPRNVCRLHRACKQRKLGGQLFLLGMLYLLFLVKTLLTQQVCGPANAVNLTRWELRIHSILCIFLVHFHSREDVPKKFLKGFKKLYVEMPFVWGARWSTLVCN